jgi:hypothetical protein
MNGITSDAASASALVSASRTAPSPWSRRHLPIIGPARGSGTPCLPRKRFPRRQISALRSIGRSSSPPAAHGGSADIEAEGVDIGEGEGEVGADTGSLGGSFKVPSRLPGGSDCAALAELPACDRRWAAAWFSQAIASSSSIRLWRHTPSETSKNRAIDLRMTDQRSTDIRVIAAKSSSSSTSGPFCRQYSMMSSRYAPCPSVVRRPVSAR